MVHLADLRLNWGVVVLAGGRVDPAFAQVIGTHRKALATLGGRTSLARVLDAVRDAGFARCATVSGPEVHTEVHHGEAVLEVGRQIANARAGAEALDDLDALLFLPADAPLLSAEALRAFALACEAQAVVAPPGPWFGAGLCPADAFRARFPALPATPLRFREGAFLSGALFATDPVGFRQGASVFEGVVTSRKNQLGMLARVGPGLILKYLARRLSFAEAEHRATRLLGGHAFLVPDCDPVMAADLDDARDWAGLQAEFREER